MKTQQSGTPTPIRSMLRASRGLALLMMLAACASTPQATPSAPHTQYGAAQQLGNGTLRAYVTVDPADTSRPLEIGVALSESAFEGLPTPRPMPAATANGGDHGAGHGPSGAAQGAHAAHAEIDSHTRMLDLPGWNPTPYTFVEVNWNPAGHEPNGVYDEPHFDFHFWTASRAVRESIDPADPAYGAKAGKLPAEAYRMEFFVDAATAAQAPPAAVAVPKMGMHWLDVRSPELQALAGHPEKQERFTKTFIYGSWDGEFVFAEPMITRAYIVAKKEAQDAAVRDEVIPVPAPASVQAPGYHPTAYRITYDAAAKEYRIALTGLEQKRN
jgi:hypothetical protein